MNEMIERVARALCAADDLDWDSQADPLMSGNGDDNQVSYRHAARAALEAMREPTEEMLTAFGRQMVRRANERLAYRAMIDAALTDPA